MCTVNFTGNYTGGWTKITTNEERVLQRKINLHIQAVTVPCMGQRGWAFPPSKMSYIPTVKDIGQESWCQLIRQFRILIVSVVKICKQCLQIASACERLPTGAALLDHTVKLVSQIPRAKAPLPQMKMRSDTADRLMLVTSLLSKLHGRTGFI